MLDFKFASRPVKALKTLPVKKHWEGWLEILRVNILLCKTNWCSNPISVGSFSTAGVISKQLNKKQKICFVLRQLNNNGLNKKTLDDATDDFLGVELVV